MVETQDQQEYSGGAQQNANNQRQGPAVSATSQADTPRKKWWQNPKRIEHTIQASTLVFVGAYTIITFCLFINTRDANRAQLTKLTESVGEAKRQANAAETQIDIARDTEERQLRAYVVFSSKEIENFEEGKTGHVQGILENLGQTPVYDAAWKSGINIAPPTGTFSYPECTSIMSEPKKWFFGKFSYPDKDRATPFTPDEINRVKAGLAVVYFNGRVCYRDIFKKARHTDFCIRWGWQNGSLHPATYCEQGNEAD